MKRAFRILGEALSVAAGCYAGYVAVTYLRHSSSSRLYLTSKQLSAGTLLDSLMPEYEVHEEHQVEVQAPAEVAFAAAQAIPFAASPVVRLIFALREIPARLMGTVAPPVQYDSLFDEVIALGWRQIGGVPGRQIIMGAVTQPWKKKVEFLGLPVEEFVGFDRPGYAKIAWTLEVCPLDDKSCFLRTETRVCTTDPVSREKFRRYWAFLSPGIIMIRYEILRLAKNIAERRVTKSTP